MSERRLALLIAIDEYPYCPPELQLQGCVNDLLVWQDLLTSPSAGFDFAASGITRVENAQATRDGILAAFDELAEKAGPDDVVFVQYSGHGSQVPEAIPGSAGNQLSETIVPSDARNPADNGPRKDITDDEIHQKLLALVAKTPRVTLVFDSCHSGSVTRDLFASRVRQIPPDLRASDPAPAPAPAPASPSAWGIGGGSYTALSACRNEESAHEYDPDVKHGALTWFLTRALSNARPGATYRDVFEQASAGVAGVYTSQHPQIEGQVDRVIFGLSEFTPMRFLPVVGRNGNVATIGGGAAQTVDVGSRWDVYPAGTHEVTGEKPLGTLVVTATAATTATATVESEASADAVTVPSRAVRVPQKLGDTASSIALRIGIADDGSPLAGLVHSSPLLAVVAPDDPSAYARVSVSDATVAVAGPDGLPLVPPRPGSDPGTPRKVCDDLEIFARYKRVLDLENPGSSLNGVVDLELLRQAPDGSWVVAAPDPVEGKIVFGTGDKLGLRLTNNHTAPLYPAVLDLGLAYGVAVFPGCAGKEVLDPGVTLDIVEFNGGQLDVSIPAAFPFVPGPGAPDSGIESLKLFVTTEEADYTFLEQQGVTRDIGLAPPADSGSDWGTGIRQFVVRRGASTAELASGSAVAVGGAQVSAAGVTASSVTASPGGAGGFGLAADLDGVLGDEGLGLQTTIAMQGVAEAQGTRDMAAPTVEVQPAPPAAGQGQMLLARDEAGVLTWHFAETSRAFGGARTYRVDGAAVSPPAEDGTRGFASAIATKLLNVVVFPLVEPAIGTVADFFAGYWEAKKRPYRLRWSTPDDFAVAGGTDVQPSDWAKLSGEGKPVLLLLHNAFSRSFSSFGTLPREAFTELHQHYDGRVIALDHFTLSHTPRQNVDWLVEQIPDGTELRLDLIGHGRGGLVARSLVEHQSEFSLGSRKLSAGRVVLVASPNAGTALADGSQLGALINVFTNILNCFPDIGVTDVLAGIVTVAKMIAVGAVNGLDGLTAMAPGTDFQKWLNAGPAVEGVSYCALAADHESSAGRIVAFAGDALVDHVFSMQQNDLVVPTSGVFSENGAGMFPIGGTQRYVFPSSAGVTHTTFFANPTTQEKLKEWLIGG
jgi:hypothetical protein